MKGDPHFPRNDAEVMENLMVLDALGETTPEQKLRLNEALVKNSALAARHAALTSQAQQVEGIFQTQAPAAADTKTPPLPANILKRIENDRREAMTNLRKQHCARANIVAFPTSIQNYLPAWLAKAAIITLLGVVTGYWFLNDKRPPVASAALAPRGATGLTQPMIVWENKPEQKYDVWILPHEGSQMDAPALFTAKNVRSPLTFSDLQPTDAAEGQKELQPGKRYRLLVCLATLGRLAGVTVPFETTAEAGGRLHVPSDVPAALLKAKRLINSGKPGDALMVLSTLPESERSSGEARALEGEATKKLPSSDGVPRG